MSDIFDDWYDVHIEEQYNEQVVKDYDKIWRDMSELIDITARLAKIGNLAKARKIQRAWRRYKSQSAPLCHHVIKRHH